MASPVSIGDALLLGKIAFRLGQAFTSGRKSAPAEFREVENQLYSLSVALSALHSIPLAEQLVVALGLDESGRGILGTMLANCEGTLSHLKKIVDEYARLNTRSEPEAPIFKKWGKRLTTDIKKIKWTTEGGNLATLRSQLMVHINSINAVLGVLNNMQTGRVQDTLAGAVALLREIQQYIAAGSLPTQLHERETMVVKDPPLTSCFFELRAATTAGEEALCSRAWLSPDWDKRARPRPQGEKESDPKVFTCACQSTAESALPPHNSRLNSYSLTPFSFAIRLVDQELSWMIYKVADRNSGRQISLVIRKLSPMYWMDFDELFVRRLALSRARSWLSQDISTTLAFVANDPVMGPEVRVLNLLGDISVDIPSIENISFSTMGHTYSRSDLEDIQITHYLTCGAELLHSGTRQNPPMKPADFAEIVIYYGGRRTGAGVDIDDDVVKTTLLVRFDTKVEYKHATVTFTDIRCASTDSNGEEFSPVTGTVEVTFSISSAAQHFHEKIQQVRGELSVILLRLPRPSEVEVMKLQVGGVHTEEIAIAESDITIVRNTGTNALRLIITSHDGRTVVSQNLSPDFMGTENSRVNFRSLTWVVQVEESGRTRKTRYPHGFTHLALSDVRTNRLFNEWARSQLWQGQLPYRNEPELSEMGSV